MKLITEKGEVFLKDKFLSTRLIRETLEKKFTVRVLDEGPNYIKFRIIRFGRLYGFPFIWPQASIEVWFKNETDKLIYKFFWPEYLALIIPFILFLVVEESLRGIILFWVFALIFFGFIMFLDTRWVSRRVRKAFENI